MTICSNVSIISGIVATLGGLWMMSPGLAIFLAGVALVMFGFSICPEEGSSE